MGVWTTTSEIWIIPIILCSVYGSGENGHTFQNTIVDIKKGIVGITDTNIDGGAAYAYPSGVTPRAHNSVWIVKKTNDGYYYVIHAATGKYVIYEVPLPNDPNTNTNSDGRYVERGQTYVDNAHTYLQYKQEHLTKRDRNNGTSWNQVALASGVFLELTTEMSTPKNKVYGDITGKITLPLSAIILLVLLQTWTMTSPLSAPMMCMTDMGIR